MQSFDDSKNEDTNKQDLKRNHRGRSNIPAIISFLIVAMAPSCAPPRDAANSTRLKYGHSEGWESGTILSIAPGSTLAVCDKGTGGQASSSVVKAIMEWASGAGMSNQLKVVEACGNQNEITLYTGGCEEAGAAGAAAFTSFWGEQGKWKINYCNTSYVSSYDITLHEVGHIFGQCDRYGSGSLGHPVKGQSCADSGPGTDGNYNAPSAMQAGGPNHPHRITEDDKKGVQALIARNDISGASRWRTAINSGIKPNSNQLPSNPNNNSDLSQNPNNSNAPQSNPLPNNNNNQNGACVLMSQLGQFIPMLSNCDQNGFCKLVESALCPK